MLYLCLYCFVVYIFVTCDHKIIWHGLYPLNFCKSPLPPAFKVFFGASKQYHRSTCLVAELGRVTLFILVTVKMDAGCYASFSHLIFDIMRFTKQMDLVRPQFIYCVLTDRCSIAGK